MEPEPEERKGGTLKGQIMQETDNGTVNSEGLNQDEDQSPQERDSLVEVEQSFAQSVPEEIDDSNILSQR